ncbi:MAG: adenylate/guanylate cyclase domain-containing protein [Rhodobacterales bacterium]|nr:adenylate/guanylate cyclase domain-containing protein [Rhodobacterales bacterium]
MVVALLAAGVAYGLRVGFWPLQVMETWLDDFRAAHAAPIMPLNEDIVILGMADSTLDALPYRSPLDRGFLADVLSALLAKKPRAIGIDILFDQPTEPEKDARLKAVLADAPVPVIMAWANPPVVLSPRRQAYLSEFLSGLHPAYVNLQVDKIDGGIRKARPAMPDQPVSVSLVAALASAVGVTPPTEPHLIEYRRGPDGAAGPFRVFPLQAVPLLPESWLAGKIVLIGATAAGTDRHPTPFSSLPGAGKMPGVEIHAHVLAQYLDGQTAAGSGAYIRVVMLLVAAALGVGLAALPLALAWRVAAGLGILVVVWVGVFLLPGGVPVPPLGATTLAFLGGLGGGGAVIGRRVRAQRRFIRDAFSKYVSPQIVANLERHPERLALGGERRVVTYLFSDLANFTTLSEATPPEVLVPLLNDYLDHMVALVRDHNGTVDKIIGDAVVAMFGAPDDDPSHAANAVACALAMNAFARGYEARKADEGITLGKTRIGVNTGPATVGNFGGSAFFDYTAFGDTVNTAARLEGANKSFGTRVAVSRTTADLCDGAHAFRPVGEIRLKGKTETVGVLEPLEAATPGSAPVAAYAAAYAALDGGGEGALALFQALVRDHPDDPLAALHLARLQAGETGTEMTLTSK